MKKKVCAVVCFLAGLMTVPGCMNPQNLNSMAFGSDCPKMILPNSGDRSFIPPVGMLSIRVSDNTSYIWSSGVLAGAPVPSRIFVRKEGSTTEYPIDSYIDQGGLLGSSMYKHALTRSTSKDSVKTSEQLLILQLPPGIYWISGVVFCGYTGRTEFSRETSGFRVEAAGCQYIGCLDLTVTQRDKNILFGDKLVLNGKIEHTEFKTTDFEWAEKEYGSSRISAFRK